LGIETAKSKTTFNYTLDAYFYDETDTTAISAQTAENEDYIGHYAALDTSYAITHRLTLGLNDSFYETRRADRYDEYTDYTERNKHYINRFTPRLVYDFEDRFSLGLRYRRQDIDYDDTESGDSVEHRGVIDLIYNPSRTTTLDLDYQHWKLNNEDNTPDHTSDQVRLIFQKRFKYFFFEGGGGYHHRSFENSALPDGKSVIFKVAVGGQNPPSFVIGRRVYDETSLGIKSHIYLDYERNFNDLGALRIDDRFTLRLGHLFFNKIKVALKAFYAMSDYDTQTGPTPEGTIEFREDDIYGIEGGIRYLLNDEWDFLITGGITERDSNIVGRSYENTFFTFNLTYRFPVNKDRW